MQTSNLSDRVVFSYKNINIKIKLVFRVLQIPKLPLINTPVTLTRYG